MDRLSLKAAAELLGISEDGVRKRVKRGSIPHERDQDGKIYVYLDASETQPDTSGDTRYLEALVEQLRSENAYLREEARRKDHLLAAALERIPAIEAPEAPQEPRESPETATEHAANGARPTTKKGGLNRGGGGGSPHRALPSQDDALREHDALRPV